jgi:hypothetical protein
MREGLILLYQLDYEDTHNIMRKNLAKIFEGNSDWKWAQLNSLGWAIGSIASNANSMFFRRKLYEKNIGNFL